LDGCAREKKFGCAQNTMGRMNEWKRFYNESVGMGKGDDRRRWLVLVSDSRYNSPTHRPIAAMLFCK
jgi:hypothetical protein